MTLKLSCSTLWWKDEPIEKKHFERLAAAGCHGMELSDYHPNFDYMRAGWLRETGAAARDAGVRIETVHIHLKSYDPQIELAHPDPIGYRRSVEAHLRAVDALHLLGAENLVTHDIRNVQDLLKDPGRTDQVIQGLVEVAAYAMDAGIRVAVENTPGTEVPSLVRFVARVAHPNIRVCFDTAHALIFQTRNPERTFAEALTSAAPYIGVVHLNDQTDTESHLLPGDGDIDWAQVMQTLHSVNPAPAMIFELTNPTDIEKARDRFLRLLSL